METNKRKNQKGFSIVELIITMTVMLIALSIVSTIVFRSFSTRLRESRTSDALVSAQAALSVMSREVSNAGFGLYENETSEIADNGIVIADSGNRRIRFRSNQLNAGGRPEAPGPTTLAINEPGEDVTYFFDAATLSIVRFDPHGLGENQPSTSVIVNKVSDVRYEYFDYSGATALPTGPNLTPTIKTGRVRITVEVQLDRVEGQVNPDSVIFSSEVALRNNSYMLLQY
jgi:prepilin-type N-terminal cleavage/methylation domain-containing protein